MAITPVGFEGQVNEAPFAKMTAALGGSGVVGTYNGTDFAATGVAGQRNVLVQGQPSTLWAPGVLVTMDADASPAAGASLNSSGFTRIDLVVMRVNWTTDACALMIVEGTGSSSPTAPTTYNKIPGTVFDVVLAEMTLPHNAGQYQSIRDRRVWLQDGVMAQPAGSTLPETDPGRLLTQPDTGRIILGGFGSERWTFRADSDTDWVTVMGAPAGFTGSLKGRVRNGFVKLAFNWTKDAVGTGTGVDFSVSLPSGWWPAPGVDITETIWAGSNPCRLYISAGTGSMGFNDVTMAAGQIITGSPVYVYQYALL